MITVGRFSWKENRQDPLGSGGTPAAFLLPFVAEDKRKWPRIGQFFVRIAFFMRGQTMKPFFYMRSCRAAPPFFPQRKGGKKRQGALPPEPPGILIFRAIVGHHNGG